MAEHDYAHFAEMDLRRTGAARLNQTQRRPMETMLASSDFDTIEKIDPFTQMKTNPGPHARGRGRGGRGRRR
jgi:hypothetical protein